MLNNSHATFVYDLPNHARSSLYHDCEPGYSDIQTVPLAVSLPMLTIIH